MTEKTNSCGALWFRSARFALFVALLTSVVGCGGTASVTGSVTSKSKNKKLVWGSVTMIGQDNIPRGGMITPEGTYTINGISAGPVKILVTSDNPKPSENAAARGRGGRDGDKKRGAAPGEAAAAPPEEIIKGWFPISEKYGDASKTTLTTTLNKGSNIYDIILD
jgi:hypothetical protein